MLDMELTIDPLELQPLGEHDFEKNFNHQEAREWVQNNRHKTFYIVVAYVILIFGIQNFMKERRPYNLRSPLTLWSLSLALFSAIGALRTWKQIAFILATKGLKQSLCSRSFFIHPISKLWIYLFVISKLLELGDTVFIVLRKKPLIFLHWYHHSTALILSWYGYSDMLPGNSWNAAVNYSVHAIMYSYYSVRAAGFQVPRFVAIIITTVQILQIMGFIIMNILIVTWMEDKICHAPWTMVFLSFTLYVSLLVLFFNFFFKTYLRSTQKPKRK